MDPKNVEALTYGAEYMLAKFVNLPDKPGDSKPAEEFRERFGELFPGIDPENYWVDVSNFRKAWHAKTTLDRARISAYMTNLFNRKLGSHVKPMPRHAILSGDPRYYPAVEVDFSSGQIAVSRFATLLDWLAMSLSGCRRKLGICEREGCTTPYFVKMHSRSRYCSEECFRQSRLEKKNQWWKNNRGKGSQKSVPHRKMRAKKATKKGRR
jgi:hypothetical protein